MDKRRLAALEATVKRKTGKNDTPPPGFFTAGNEAIDTYRENLLRQGFTLEQVLKVPVFIE